MAVRLSAEEGGGIFLIDPRFHNDEGAPRMSLYQIVETFEAPDDKEAASILESGRTIGTRILLKLSRELIFEPVEPEEEDTPGR